jgi:hypothetical protein
VVRDRLRESGWATNEPHRLRRRIAESRRHSAALKARAQRAPARLRRLAARV